MSAAAWLQGRPFTTTALVMGCVLGLASGVLLLSLSTRTADLESLPPADLVVPDAGTAAGTAGNGAAAITPAIGQPDPAITSPSAHDIPLPPQQVPEAMTPIVSETRDGQSTGAGETPPPEPSPVAPAGEISSASASDGVEGAGEATPVERVAKRPDVRGGSDAAAAAASRRVRQATAPKATRTPPDAPSMRSTPKYHGSLAIRSTPSSAVVSVDGQVVGSTPIVLDAVAIGSRIVRIEAPGYERWSSVARVVANRKASIDASLQPTAR